MDIDNLARVLHTEEGRHLVADILALCGEGCHVVTGNPIQDSYTSGRKAIADDLLHIIRQIDSANENSDGLAMEYTMRRESQRRIKEEEHENSNTI